MMGPMGPMMGGPPMMGQRPRGLMDMDLRPPGTASVAGSSPSVQSTASIPTTATTIVKPAVVTATSSQAADEDSDSSSSSSSSDSSEEGDEPGKKKNNGN